MRNGNRTKGERPTKVTATEMAGQVVAMQQRVISMHKLNLKNQAGGPFAMTPLCQTGRAGPWTLI